MADHNDPNAVNHIFSDIDYSPADLYDLFGWPTAESKNVVFALTFASAPAAGVLDIDLLYRLLFTSHPRVAWPESATSVWTPFCATLMKSRTSISAS